MGEAVSAWVLATGPEAVTNYNFLKLHGATMDSSLVTRRPIEASASQLQQKHDLADIFDVTDLGRSTAKVKPHRQVFGLTLYCSGHGCGRHNAADRTNCLRACGGAGACVAGCCKEGTRGHCCAVRLVVSIKCPDLLACWPVYIQRLPFISKQRKFNQRRPGLGVGGRVSWPV